MTPSGRVILEHAVAVVAEQAAGVGAIVDEALNRRRTTNPLFDALASQSSLPNSEASAAPSASPSKVPAITFAV
jgi:hypothetical protein